MVKKCVLFATFIMQIGKKGIKMPNWTDNQATIIGKTADVEKLIADITNEDGTYALTNVYPTPTELENIHQGSRNFDGVRHDAWYEDEDGVRPLLDMFKLELVEKYGTYKSIDWQYNNWGTKWGDCQTTIKWDGEVLYVGFESAWGEPFLLLQEIATKYNVNINNKWDIEFGQDSGQTIYPFSNGEEVKADHIKSLQESRDKIDSMFK